MAYVEALGSRGHHTFTFRELRQLTVIKNNFSLQIWNCWDTQYPQTNFCKY